jgi:type VI secretion system secreted protein Hcp
MNILKEIRIKMQKPKKTICGFIKPVFISACLAASASSPALARSDCYLKIDGVEGSAATRGFERQIELTSFSWEEKNSSAMSGGGTGRVAMDNFRVSMRADKSSPALMLLAANGTHRSQAVLSCTGLSSHGEMSLIHRWTLSDVAISVYQSGWTAGPNNPAPMDQASLSFTKIGYEHVPAGIKVEWDLTQNRGGLVSGASQPAASQPAQQAAPAGQQTSTKQQAPVMQRMGTQLPLPR